MASPAHDVHSRASSEKGHEKHAEVVPDPALVPTVVDRNAGLDPKAVRSALLRLDLIVLPVVVAFYLLSFIDRANVRGRTSASR